MDIGALSLNVTKLVDQLAALTGSERLYNPYSGVDAGSEVRRGNLIRYLDDMYDRQPDTVLVFEAPGYRGCRFSGIPVTSERIMMRGIPKWKLFGEGYVPTSDQVDGIAEMTATILWETLQTYADSPPLIWNTVPLHPHKPDQPMSNRTPTISEQRAGVVIAAAMLHVFKPSRVLAVGRIAQAMLKEQGIDAIPIRHPSQGGKPDFVRGIREQFS
jgi:uracil-DNA glycosylase